MRHPSKLYLRAGWIAFAFPVIAAAQSIDLLTPGHRGLSIGDSRRVDGLRINFRDRRMEQVNGVNITVWTPHRESRGDVNGIAIGLPIGDPYMVMKT